MTSLDFGEVARAIGTAARAQGHEIPTFRSPPRVVGAQRTVRRRPGGGATVSIQLRNRPRPAIVADMIEGIVVTNRLVGTNADDCRRLLWSAVEGEPDIDELDVPEAA